MNKNIKIFSTILILIIICVITFVIINSKKQGETIRTNAQTLSNQKIGWGIKREPNHVQPDLGTKNKELIHKYSGIAIGNPEKKYVYLTFDEGYEAGYTPRILQILKENDVPATFFLTAHYINTRRRISKRNDKRWTHYRKPFLRYSDDLKNKIDKS